MEVLTVLWMAVKIMLLVYLITGLLVVGICRHHGNNLNLKSNHGWLARLFLDGLVVLTWPAVFFIMGRGK